MDDENTRPAGKSVGILCAGKSVQRFLDQPVAHDYILGVNRLASVYPCDFWAFNDHEAFGWWPAIEKEGRLPMIFTSNQAHKLIAKHPEQLERANGHVWLFYPQIQTTCPVSTHWTNYSMLIAMVLAQYLGAERICIYGSDWAGSDDFDGTAEKRASRHEERWKNEEHWFGHVSAWLEGCGVSVTRVGAKPKGPSEMAKNRRNTSAAADTNVAPTAMAEHESAAPTDDKAAALSNYRPVVIPLEMRREKTIDGHHLPIGTVVGEVVLTHPAISLGFLTQGFNNDIIGRHR